MAGGAPGPRGDRAHHAGDRHLSIAHRVRERLAQRPAVAGAAAGAGVARTTARVAQRSRECLRLAGIAARADELAGSIGHGDQRLLEIAIALALKPRVLLLDERRGMSVKESWEIVKRLREIRDRDRLTVLIVEHDMEIVMERPSDHGLHLGQTLAEGTPEEVGRNPDVQRVYLGAVMLSLQALQAQYGKSRVLHGVTLDVAERQIAVLIGRNGVARRRPSRPSWGW